MCKDIPKVKNLVEVRDKKWIVLNIEKENNKHIVLLSSVENNEIGHEIKIIWELESKHYEAKKIDDEKHGQLSKIVCNNNYEYEGYKKLNAYIDAARWCMTTAFSSNDKFYSLGRCGIDVSKTYQWYPLNQVICHSRNNLLLADDVGFGKTIEAGMIIQELIMRRKIKKVLILCPSHLRMKWKKDMYEKFCLKFEIIDKDYDDKFLKYGNKDKNVWESFPCVITSIDWIKDETNSEKLQNGIRDYDNKLFDLLVIDEVHNLSNKGTERYKSISNNIVKKNKFQYKLLLSATPSNGYLESVKNIINLFKEENELLQLNEKSSKVTEELNKYMIRREKENFQEYFKEEKECYINFSYSKNEVEILTKFLDMAEENKKEILKKKSNEQIKGIKDTYHLFYRFLAKRFFSSIRAFRNTINRIIENKIGDKDYEDNNKIEIRNISKELKDYGINNNEKIKHIQKLIKNNIGRHNEDSKLNAVIKDIKEHFNKYDNNIIIFSEWIDTIEYIHTKIEDDGLLSEKTEEVDINKIHGGTNNNYKDKIIKAFQNSDNRDKIIMLTTDVNSAGLDLQNRCNYLIHYDIPWNPNNIKQRNGRISRIGQREDCVYIKYPKIENNEEKLIRVKESINVKINEKKDNIEKLMDHFLNLNEEKNDKEIDTIAINSTKRNEDKETKEMIKYTEEYNKHINLNNERIKEVINIYDNSMKDSKIIISSKAKKTNRWSKNQDEDIYGMLSTYEEYCKCKKDVKTELLYLNHSFIKNKIMKIKNEFLKDKSGKIKISIIKANGENIKGDTIIIWFKIIILYKTIDDEYKLDEELIPLLYYKEQFKNEIKKYDNDTAYKLLEEIRNIKKENLNEDNTIIKLWDLLNKNEKLIFNHIKDKTKRKDNYIKLIKKPISIIFLIK